MPLTSRALAAPVAVLALAALSAHAFAADDIVKPAPTPMPSAGPTIAAAQQFCGEASGKADALISRYSSATNLKEVYKSIDYVAYGDDPKNTTVMYTFTVSGHPAHPAAVCRKIEKSGDNLVVKMDVVCDGEAGACTKLRNDFNVMTAKMQVDVDQRIAGEKK